MRILVESLKRLYHSDNSIVDIDKIKEMLQENPPKITQKEYEYIIKE